MDVSFCGTIGISWKRSARQIYDWRGKNYYSAVMQARDQHVLFKRMFSRALQSSRKWYPLSTSICGVSPKKYMSQSNFGSRLSTENAEVAYSELIDENGAQPSPSELDGCKKSGKWGYKKETVVVASSFGVIASMPRQNPTKAFLFDEKRCGRVREFHSKRWPLAIEL